MFSIRTGCFLLSLCVLTVPALAAEQPEVEEKSYATCFSLVETAPKKAITYAKAWFETGDGVAASHCEAAALLQLNRPIEAESILTALATMFKEPQMKAPLLGQAGQAAFMGGAYDRAESLLDEAISLSPTDRFYLDRALVYAEQKKLEDALNDIGTVLAAQPENQEALVLQAAAYRRLDRMDQAESSLKKARVVNADAPDLLLEEGLLALRKKDAVGAQKHFARLFEVAPKSPAADEARALLREAQKAVAQP